MMPLTARRGWLGPLLVFALVLALMVSVPTGIARGSTTTTFAAVSPSGATEGQPSVVGSSSVGSLTAIFTVRAKDLGDFAADVPTIRSPAAILINADTGKVLYERKADVRRPMASTTKIMTGILILENMDLKTPVTVSKIAAQTPEPATWLREGDVLTVEQLLYALLLRSANSAAVALAEACSGSVEAFVAMMNAKAKELGMNDTQFVNPNGLDKTGHYSTAADMARLGQYAMKNEEFRKIVSTLSYTLSLPGRSAPLVFENHNVLLGRLGWVTGIKTGLTPKAEQCLVGFGHQRWSIGHQRRTGAAGAGGVLGREPGPHGVRSRSVSSRDSHERRGSGGRDRRSVSARRACRTGHRGLRGDGSIQGRRGHHLDRPRPALGSSGDGGRVVWPSRAHRGGDNRGDGGSGGRHLIWEDHSRIETWILLGSLHQMDWTGDVGR